MQIDKQLVQHIASTARLQLSEQEINEFIPQLKEILDMFSQLDQIDVKNTLPSFHPILLENVTREDKIKPSLTQEQALSLTKHKEDGYFKGPKIL
ncbi:Asp-tRNA(Asn)/Glu-tRNA(Gln) amidotransferase subunit GatC [Candidatus Woesearchaeota archaeon]|nr:Asp-tRNA(Asn)/Glu-tRNA(Gln) amidotransferase subunit GatC [Candidatus Woesearchaeota archaeon]